MLKEFAKMSQVIGKRIDYVQGGGGNTSVKLGNGLMVIKASGYRLSQVTESDGFAVVEIDGLKNVTKEQGYKLLRPSVEAGFHTLLDNYVLHTHPVYANLALCSVGGVDNLPSVIDGYHCITVPYIDPGKALADAIKEKIDEKTQVVFMRNHGLTVTADTADECLHIHECVNNHIANEYGVTADDFQSFLREINKILYPDQQVYLDLSDAQNEIMTAVMFIHFTLMKNGKKAHTMDENAMRFIAEWESEAYRKSILKKGGFYEFI